jgi:versiconal hemiacetal acetate esterase
LNVYTVGTSAGGGIALAVANHLIKAGKRSSIKGIAAFVPVTVHPSYGVPSKYKEKYTSYKENATGVPLIDAGTMDTFFKSVDCKPDCAITFALLSDVLAEFPKTYIATCGKDPLRDDGAVLELMLKEAGATAKRDHYPGFPHVFWILPGMETAAKFLDNAVQGIKYVLSD